MLVAVTMGALSAAAADAPVPAAVRVGGHTLTRAEVAERLARLPDFQRAALGASPSAQARTLIERAIVPELLYAEQAQALKLGAGPARDRVQDVLARAVDEALREELRRTRPITPEEVKAYYEAHRLRFVKPERIRLWRIVVADEERARALIQETTGTEGPTRWSQAARDHSLDKATALRQGDLGFVHPTGHTDVPQVRVDPELYRAAQTVKDGEVVPTPVREGARFAVIWRRGSLPESRRSLEDERAAITALLERERLEETRQALIDRLRREHLRAFAPEALTALEFEAFGDEPTRRRPGAAPELRVRQPIVPAPTDRGLR